MFSSLLSLLNRKEDPFIQYKKEDFFDISDDREGSLAEIDDKLRRELRKIE